jgi:MbtH protein
MTTEAIHLIEPDDEGAIFRVLVNDEQQYALWPAILEIPDGWRQTGHQGTKAQCSRYVGEVWRDMRPRSLRAARDPERRTT